MKSLVAALAVFAITASANASQIITITGPAAEELYAKIDGNSKNISCYVQFIAACSICAGGQNKVACNLRVDGPAQMGDNDEMPQQMQ